MASIVLSAAGTAVGSAVGGPFGAAIGQQLGSVVGSAADSELFGAGGSARHRNGARLEQLAVQTSTYGDFIPIVYGNVRIAGNVIWALPMREVATTTTTTQGKGGGSASSSSTEFSYFATLAIAVCEGEVDQVERVWADAKQLDLGLGTYRFYNGSEEQLPDTLIESFEGVGSTPAYRGLCYVVIEDFPLADYGNRIPNFTFEVKRKALWRDVGDEPVENLLKEMVLIPGSGEFVYDTQVQHKVDGEQLAEQFAQSGEQTRINQHTAFNKANALVALDQLEDTCPNLAWVALVVNWFGTSMDLNACQILPGVEFGADEATTQPEVWSVAGYGRGNAHAITYVGDSPRYGGTPDDESIVRLCDELQARGKKILFLPLFLMDTDDKPWRGRLSGAASQMANFFNKPDGYNAYVMHYANLLKNHVDAFAIGSEMRGITQVHDGAAVNRSFEGVNQLVALANSVKATVGAGVKVTYAADWSEYHHDADGWYHMDTLWASPAIDMIGIDAYFPLTDALQSEIGYEASAIQLGWISGEGYDWFYADEARSIQEPLAPAYAWKNIEWFWRNSHINPDGNPSPWQPEAKKIWFTEFGFPSVDAATNQPNVFYDETSSESFFPYRSRGRVDFRAQRAGIAATLAQWQGSAFIEKTFLWAWDARPYPYWPDLTQVWADGDVWVTGHWVQGKIGLSSLAAIVADLSVRAGLRLSNVQVDALTQQVDGFVIKSQDTARGLIENLMAAYFFDAAQTDGQIKFVPRGGASVATIAHDNLAPPNENAAEALQVKRLQELELPQRIEVNYLNRLAQYQTSTQASQRYVSSAADTEVMRFSIVMSDQYAKLVADVSLYHAWVARMQFEFDLPMQYADLEPADVLQVSDANNVVYTVRITNVQFGKPGRIHVQASAEDVQSYDAYAPPALLSAQVNEAVPIAATKAHYLDLPALPHDGEDDAYLRMAATGLAANWNGAVIYRSDDDGGSYSEIARMSQAATIATATSILPAGPRNRFDGQAYVDVLLLGNAALASVSEQALLNGANLALLGDELIQFQQAELIGANKYRLSRLLRGRMGTEEQMHGHAIGEVFVLLNAALERTPMPQGLFGLQRRYKAVSVGQTLGIVADDMFRYTANALKPYSPVHVAGTRDALGNVRISWIRRTRIGGNWRDGADVPLAEKSEAYELRVLREGNMVRRIATNIPQADYSAQQELEDFGEPQTMLQIEVVQLSQSVGAGQVARTNIVF